MDNSLIIGLMSVAIIVLFVLQKTYRDSYEREKKTADGLMERLIQANKTILHLKEELKNSECSGQDKKK